MSEPPKTLIEAVVYFSDFHVCHSYMMSIKWPAGKVICPECSNSEVGQIKSRLMFQCKNKECRKQFSTKVGTIFEDSALPLSKWFVAVWLIANCKHGASSSELARAVGVTQKTGWHMLHRISLAMQANSFRKLCGEVESDETFIGGKAKNMHRSKRRAKISRRGGAGKAIVHGVLERGGEIRTTVVPDQKRHTLQTVVRRYVEKGADVFTDSIKSYEGLADEYVHKKIDHAISYVERRVHTTGIENFWLLLKRSLGGTYVAVAVWNLFRYVDEQAWRFNNRKFTDSVRFSLAMRSVVGRRLTWNGLTAH